MQQKLVTRLDRRASSEDGLKCDPTGDQGRDGFEVDRGSGCPNGYREAGGVPEPRRGSDKLVVGRVDDRLSLGRSNGGYEPRLAYASNLDTIVQDGRAGTERGARLSAQQDRQAPLAAIGQGRFVQSKVRWDKPFSDGVPSALDVDAA